jgi:hypothetical protein
MQHAPHPLRHSIFFTITSHACMGTMISAGGLIAQTAERSQSAGKRKTDMLTRPKTFRPVSTRRRNTPGPERD